MNERPTTPEAARAALRAYRESLTPEALEAHENYAGRVLAAIGPKGRRMLAPTIEQIPWEKLSPEQRARACVLLAKG